MRQQENDWIEYIADKVYEYYEGRKVVLWGKYKESDNIKDKLDEKYQIDTVFYVDSDAVKIDNKEVFPAECLIGKAAEYYVVIPLAVYETIREFLLKSGYRADLDYYYFSDCIIRQEDDYYEDAHGNKIIGRYAGMKVAFSGFGSVIEIGTNAKFQQASCYVHNNSRIKIGSNVKLLEVSLYVHNDSMIIIGNCAEFRRTSLHIENCANALFGSQVQLTGCNLHMLDSSRYEAQSECRFNYLSMGMGNHAEAFVDEKVEIIAADVNISRWSMLDYSKLEIGSNGKFKYGLLHMQKNALLKIGHRFSIQVGYVFAIGEDTNVTIGDEGLFSSDIALQSDDGHSIFDVTTGYNINSTYDIRKQRKIVIGNHVWVGTKAAILYNTRIADGSIVGAMSLVKGQIPGNCIAAGVPARIIRRDVAWSRENGSENILDCGEDYIHLTGESVR